MVGETSAPAPAQDDIVVTARNHRERLSDVPIAILAIDSKQIERQKVETFADVARLDSSLLFDVGSGLQDTRPVIRGLPSSRGRPPVGILIDGVDASTESMGASAGGSTLLNTRAIEIDRIEVVKGPQSALYGRVAFGGDQLCHQKAIRYAGGGVLRRSRRLWNLRGSGRDYGSSCRRPVGSCSWLL